MECAIFTLLGVVIGVAASLVSGGEKVLFVKKDKESEKEYEAFDEVREKSEEELMQQWRNLLGYCAEQKIEE